MKTRKINKNSFNFMKALKALLPMLFCSFLLTSCWSSKELNSLGIVVCMGIDKEADGYLVTEQVINIRAIASKRVVNESPIEIYTQKDKDITQAIRKMTTQTRKRLYHAHLLILAIGEETAKEGINEYIDFISRGYEFNTEFDFVIVKNGTANDMLKVLTPIDTIPGMSVHGSLHLSKNKWAQTKSTGIWDLIQDLTSDGKDPAISGIEITGGTVGADTIEELYKSDINNRLEFTGLAAFSTDKLAGWLDEEESKGYNYIMNKVKSTVGYVDYDNGGKMTYEIIKSQSKIKAVMKNDSPEIEVKIKVNADIIGLNGDLDIAKIENTPVIKALLEKELYDLCMQSIKKAKELKSDIFGFGEAINQGYPKHWKNLKEDWNDEFTDLPVNISVDVTLDKIGAMAEPVLELK